ncbi:hypothetical protein HYH03_014632 [Edaphochlamys debaryana]|uniref:Uncharacterized protein n=1 Tax=Edaphochlamys debaryana TaxID=47281 RepID=A0A836BTC1_9CHLO|nr:hypothetical protein HYH03_014632 [Edaphochlamys debaryana]|eukprot:KAG2486703.1 hypothetical protein HYH03_014632 [Edaphochlamys debaryana]
MSTISAGLDVKLAPTEETAKEQSAQQDLPHSAKASALDAAPSAPEPVEHDAAAQQQDAAGTVEEDLEASLVDEHQHYTHRNPWLRAFVLGANDGLVSVAALMLGVGGGDASLHTMRLAGLAAWIAGALSMACGEYISVASQRDTEQADIEKERQQQQKGPAARAVELQELADIYVARGLTRELARQDVIRAHARDELGIDIDALANPTQAAIVSSLAFTAGALIPLLAGAFIHDKAARMASTAVAAVVGLVAFGLTGSLLGGVKPFIGALRVLIGGCIAMAVTYGIGLAMGGGEAAAAR